MNKTRSTPGPWRAEILTAGRFNIQGGSGFYYTVCSRGSSVGHMEAECQANARLIAEAPTMCEALESIAAILVPGPHSVSKVLDALDEARATARAAIKQAKATGNE